MFRQAGWISPVVLIDGRAGGVWSYERSKDAVLVTVVPFRRLSRASKQGIEAETVRLAGVLGAGARVRFAAAS